VFAIIEAPARGWSSAGILGCFAAAVGLGAAFVAWELHTPHPLFHLEFFRNLRFSVGAAAIMLVFFALLGGIFVLTQYLQSVLGYSPLQAGLRVMPIGGVILGAPLGSRLVEKVGSKLVVTGAMLLVGAGLLTLAFADQATGYGTIATALAIFGFGMGCTMAPAGECVMGSLPPARAGSGAGTNNTTQFVGGALGVAVIGSVLSSLYTSALAPAVVALPPRAVEAAQSSVGAALSVASSMVRPGRPWRRRRARRSSTGWGPA